MQIGSLFFKIGGKTEELDNSLKRSEVNVALFEAKILATLYAIDRFVERSTAGAFALDNLSRASGIASDQLSKTGLAASLSNAGISAQDASKQVAAFAQNLYQIKTFGTGNLEGFKALSFLTGSTFNAAGAGTPLQAIKQISEAIKNLNDQQAVDIIGKMGFSPSMLDFFRNPGKFDDLADQLKQTQEQTDSLKELGNRINELKISLGHLSDILVVDLAEPLGKLVENTAALVQILSGHPIDDLHKWITENISKPLLKHDGTLPTTQDLRDRINGKTVDGEKPSSSKVTTDTDTIRARLAGQLSNSTADDAAKRARLPSSPSSAASSNDGAQNMDDVLNLYQPSKSLRQGQAGAVSNNSSAVVTQTNNISVHGSGDPHATANAVLDAQQQLQHGLTDQLNGSLR